MSSARFISAMAVFRRWAQPASVGSRKKVKRIRELVSSLRKPSLKVTHLIPNVHDDRITLILELFPLRSLELDGRFRREIVRLQDQRGPFVACRSQVGFSGSASTFRASGKKEHGNSTVSGQADEGQHRLDRLCLGHQDPGGSSALSTRKLAGHRND